MKLHNLHLKHVDAILSSAIGKFMGSGGQEKRFLNSSPDQVAY